MGYMPRGVKRQIEYTGKAAKINEKVQKLEAELKAAKEELKAAYKAQVKEEKKAAAAVAKAKKDEVYKAIQNSGKTAEEILAFLNS